MLIKPNLVHEELFGWDIYPAIEHESQIPSAYFRRITVAAKVGELGEVTAWHVNGMDVNDLRIYIEGLQAALELMETYAPDGVRETILDAGGQTLRVGDRVVCRHDVQGKTWGGHVLQAWSHGEPIMVSAGNIGTVIRVNEGSLNVQWDFDDPEGRHCVSNYVYSSQVRKQENRNEEGEN